LEIINYLVCMQRSTALRTAPHAYTFLPRGFLLWGFSYARPVRVAARVNGPASENLHKSRLMQRSKSFGCVSISVMLTLASRQPQGAPTSDFASRVSISGSVT